MADDWWQSAPGKIAPPPILSWESGAKKYGDPVYTVMWRNRNIDWQNS